MTAFVSDSRFPIPDFVPDTPLLLRPRSATEIVDAAFQLYRRDPLTYLLVAAVCYAPILILQLVVLGPGVQVEQQLTRLTGGLAGVMLLGYWVSISLMSAVIVRLSSADYLGNRIEPAVAVRDALLKLPTVMFGLFFKYLLMMVGLLLFFVGVFYMLARYFAVTAGIVIEGRGVFGTLSRSAALSKGRKMHILVTSLLAFLIFIVLYVAVAIVAGIAGNLVISTVLTVVASILAYPMFAITEMLLYYDARVRNEGYDIEMMAEAM